MSRFRITSATVMHRPPAPSTTQLPRWPPGVAIPHSNSTLVPNCVRQVTTIPFQPTKKSTAVRTLPCTHRHKHDSKTHNDFPQAAPISSLSRASPSAAHTSGYCCTQSERSAAPYATVMAGVLADHQRGVLGSTTAVYLFPRPPCSLRALQHKFCHGGGAITADDVNVLKHRQLQPYGSVPRPLAGARSSPGK